MPAFHALGMTFGAVCGQTAIDPDFKEEYETAKKIIAIRPEDRPYGVEQIEASKKSATQFLRIWTQRRIAM